MNRERERKGVNWLNEEACDSDTLDSIWLGHIQNMNFNCLQTARATTAITLTHCTVNVWLNSKRISMFNVCACVLYMTIVIKMIVILQGMQKTDGNFLLYMNLAHISKPDHRNIFFSSSIHSSLFILLFNLGSI